MSNSVGAIPCMYSSSVYIHNYIVIYLRIVLFILSVEDRTCINTVDVTFWLWAFQVRDFDIHLIYSPSIPQLWLLTSRNVLRWETKKEKNKKGERDKNLGSYHRPSVKRTTEAKNDSHLLLCEKISFIMFLLTTWNWSNQRYIYL